MWGMLKREYKKLSTELQFWLVLQQKCEKEKTIIVHVRKFRLRDDGVKGHIYLQNEYEWVYYW